MCCLVLRSNFALLLTIQFATLISSLINIISLLLTTFHLSKKDTDHVNWVCSPCLNKLKLYLREGGVTKKLDDLRVSFEGKMSEVNSKVDQVQEVLT